MKITAIVAAAALVVGVYSGIKIAGARHDAMMARANEEMRLAQEERNAQLATLSREYYEQFEAINNRKPATVERRVYVKADCVPARASTGLGNVPHAGGSEAGRAATGSAGKVALAQETVQAVAGVADKAERLYRQCVTRLKYFQEKHEHTKI